MKLEIYSPSEPEEAVTRLRLLPSAAYGGVILAVVDANGTRVPRGAILAILPDGTFRRFTGVTPPMDCDDRGRIREVPLP